MTRPRRLLVAALAALAVPLVALGWNRFGPRRTPAGQPALVRLDAAGADRLRDAFNAASAEARLVVLLSPT